MAKPGRPRAHSHEEIVQAVLGIGIVTFSMSALGRRLGIAPAHGPSLPAQI